MKSIYLSFLLVLFLTSKGVAQEDYTKGLVDFSILDLNGETFTQEDLVDEHYKLFMYFNPSCNSCKAAFKKINAEVDQLKNLPVHFYPISFGNKDETLAFFDEYAPDFLKLERLTILRESNYVFSDTYEVTAYPTLYLYKPNNDFVKSYMGIEKSTKFINHFLKK